MLRHYLAWNVNNNAWWWGEIEFYMDGDHSLNHKWYTRYGGTIFAGPPSILRISKTKQYQRILYGFAGYQVIILMAYRSQQATGMPL